MKKKKVNRVKLCDELWKRAIKERAQNKCELCGETFRLQAHHVIPRTNYSTRYLVENGIALCYKHHIHWAHKDAEDFISWMEAHRMADLNYIKRMRYNQDKNNYQEIEDRLKEYLK